MTLENVLIQAVGVLGTVVYFLSFQCKTNKRLFRLQLLSYVFYTLHLFLLGSSTGAISYVLNLVRSFCLSSDNKFLKSRKMCGILCALQLTTLALTWAGALSILPILANIASTVAGYTHNPRTVRRAAMYVNSPLWIIYDISIGSYAGILDEVVSVASIVISLIRYGSKNLDKVEM